jgi:hypothetical protein
MSAVTVSKKKAESFLWTDAVIELLLESVKDLLLTVFSTARTGKAATSRNGNSVNTLDFGFSVKIDPV